MAQQYRGSAVDIAYSPQSLREIFVNNVRLLKSERDGQARSACGPIRSKPSLAGRR